MSTVRRLAAMSFKSAAVGTPPLDDYASAVLADMPLAYYRLNESSGTAMSDSSGNAHSGTYYFTKGSTAGLLPGTSDGASTIQAWVPTASWLDVAAITIECLIKPSTTGGNAGVVTRFSGGNLWLIWINPSSQIAVRFYNAAGSSVDLAHTPTIVSGTTYHVVATYQSGQARLYIDGVQVASSTALTGSLRTGSQNLEIGTYNTNTWNFTGTFDEVALYSGELSAARIAAHYGVIAPRPTDITNLLAWYSADAVTGLSDGAQMTTWNDVSGNGMHATGAGSTKPLYQTTTGASGGPAVRFQGSGYFTLPGLWGSATSGEAVVKIKSDGSDCGLWGLGSYAGFSDESHYPYSGTVYEGFGLASGGRRSFSPSLSITSWRTYNLWSSATDHGATLDGATQLASTSVTVGFASTPLIGSGGKFDAPDMRFTGHISAVLLFGRKLTTLERSQMIAYLTAHPSGGT